MLLGASLNYKGRPDPDSLRTVFLLKHYTLKRPVARPGQGDIENLAAEPTLPKADDRTDAEDLPSPSRTMLEEPREDTESERKGADSTEA